MICNKEDYDGAGIVELSTYVKLFRDGKTVTLSITSWTSATTITIPEGYRPPSSIYFSAISRTTGTMAWDRLNIGANGTLSLETYTEVLGNYTWILL